jgi:hypothetical protein
MWLAAAEWHAASRVPCAQRFRHAMLPLTATSGKFVHDGIDGAPLGPGDEIASRRVHAVSFKQCSNSLYATGGAGGLR